LCAYVFKEKRTYNTNLPSTPPSHLPNQAALNKISFLRFDYGGASISLIAIIILFAGLGLIFSANDSLNARASENQALFFAEKKELRCKRWRAERNFWLSVLGCVLWLVLLRIQTLLMDVGPLEERLKGVEEERDSLKKEKKEKEGVLERLRAAVEEGGREGKEREGMILALKEKVGELDTLKKKVAKLEIENESLKRGEKKTS